MLVRQLHGWQRMLTNCHNKYTVNSSPGIKLCTWTCEYIASTNVLGQRDGKLPLNWATEEGKEVELVRCMGRAEGGG